MRLSPTESMLLGRSTKGFHVQDELVNVRHAEVAWVTDRYWITDLGSVTGTWVNDERLGPNQPRVIAVNDQIRVGETEFVVRERVSFSVEAVARGIGGVTIAGLVAAVIYKIASTPVIYEPKVGWPVPIRYAVGEAQILEVPLDFLRQHGFDYHQMRIRRVTDYDQDGVDEMWITHAGEEVMVTFDDSGNWVKSSSFPAGCQDQGTTHFPNLRCGVVTYTHDGKDYQPRKQDGLVAWMPPVTQAEAEGVVGQVVHRPDTWSAPVPYRMGLKSTEKLAGFLGERGISGPIHYLICEEALPGISAQVMLESGQIVPIEPGCIRSMNVNGPERTQRFGAHVPSMVAFSSYGRERLMEHLTLFMSGSMDGIFLDFRDRQVLDTMSRNPENLLLSYRLASGARPSLYAGSECNTLVHGYGVA